MCHAVNASLSTTLDRPGRAWPDGAPVHDHRDLTGRELEFREIDVATLHDVLASADPEGPAPAVVDVREDHEFVTGHVPGAVNVPLSELVDRVDEVTTLPGELYLVCEVGGRSAQVAAWLAQHGHAAVNVAGGTAAWRAAGYPIA